MTPGPSRRFVRVDVAQPAELDTRADVLLARRAAAVGRALVCGAGVRALARPPSAHGSATAGLHRIHRGVYAVGHAARQRRLLAALKACGPGAVLSPGGWVTGRPGRRPSPRLAGDCTVPSRTRVEAGGGGGGGVSTGCSTPDVTRRAPRRPRARGRLPRLGPRGVAGGRSRVRTRRASSGSWGRAGGGGSRTRSTRPAASLAGGLPDASPWSARRVHRRKADARGLARPLAHDAERQALRSSPTASASCARHLGAGGRPRRGETLPPVAACAPSSPRSFRGVVTRQPPPAVPVRRRRRRRDQRLGLRVTRTLRLRVGQVAASASPNASSSPSTPSAGSPNEAASATKSGDSRSTP